MVDELAEGPRAAEVGVVGRSAMLIGVPPRGVLRAFDRAVDRYRTTSMATPIGKTTEGTADERA
jgi:anaerobic ribonucleoside-triphosphate reductase activating protein